MRLTPKVLGVKLKKSLKNKEWVKYTFLPSIIKLGYQDIKVSEADLDDAQGCYKAEQAEIRIKQGMEPREKLNTLLHEIIHACVYTYGLKDEFKDHDHEEKVVNALGNGLTDVFVRNKELIEFVRKSV